MEHYKPAQFAKMIGVHIKTLQRWDREGIFVAHRSPTNRRYYTQADYERYQKGGEHEKNVQVSPSAEQDH